MNKTAESTVDTTDTPEITVETEDEAKTLAVYDAARAKLAELKVLYTDVTYDLTTTKGMGLATAARADLRTTRMQVEADRTEVKRPYLEACRLIDAEAKRITADIMIMESPIDADIKTEQARKREIKAAKERAEQERLAAIERERLAAEKEEQEQAAQAERERLAAEQVEIDRQRAELEAAQTEQERLAKEQQAELTAERKRLADEKAELERQARAKREEQDRLAREAREKADAVAAAERKRLADIEAKRQEEERARIAEADAKVKTEQERQAKARAKEEAAQKAAQAKREKAEVAAKAKAEAAAIKHATLLGAAGEVVACFEDWGVANKLPARKLAAAVARAGKGDSQ